MRLFALVLVLPALANANTQFTIDPSGVTCSGDLEITEFNVSCDGYCSWGSDVEVSGTVVVNNDLYDQYALVTVRAASVYDVYSSNMDLCLGMSSSSGSTCPSPGTYSISEFGFPLPGDGDSWYSEYGYWGISLPVSISFQFSDGTATYCSTSVKLSKNNGYAMAMAGSVAILGLVGAGWTFRKRRVATIQLNAEEGSVSHFEMISDSGVRV